MPRSFDIAYALYKGKCSLVNIFRESIESHESSIKGDELVGRFIGVRMGVNGALEGCLRVSFKRREFLSGLITLLQEYGITHEIVYRSRGNIVLWFSHDSCIKCPLVHATSKVTPKSMLVTPFGLLFEFICYKSKISDDLFEVLASGKADEMMEYMLTPREQEILYHAYFRGYYSQPHEVSLDRLARELGLSKSALSEILRNAERKVMTAYMRHDLPHLIVSKILKKIKELNIEEGGPHLYL